MKNQLWWTIGCLALPQYQWAFDELSPALALRPLCAELEAITGERAIDLRSKLLLAYQSIVRSTYEEEERYQGPRSPLEAALESMPHGEHDIRLGAWVTLACLRVARPGRFAQRPLTLLEAYLRGTMNLESVLQSCKSARPTNESQQTFLLALNKCAIATDAGMWSSFNACLYILEDMLVRNGKTEAEVRALFFKTIVDAIPEAP